jgi:hypothetical protein
MSGGSGARVSAGSAFEATGISTLGELVATGSGVFSFFAKACEAGGACVVVVASIPATVAGDFSGAVSGGLAVLFNAAAGAGIGLGSIELDGVDSTLATSLEAVTGTAATFFCSSQPRS